MVVVRQLGNGNAFQPQRTNTSFTLCDDRILVDCGYSVFAELMRREIVDKIEVVCITHNHDDHIGSLGSFLYYREFVLKKPIVVIGSDRVEEYLYLILYGMRKTVYPYGEIPLEYVKFIPADKKYTYIPRDRRNLRVEIEPKVIYSHSLNEEFPSVMYSFVFKTFSHERIEKVLYRTWTPKLKAVFTGDTRANPQIEEFAFTPPKIVREVIDNSLGMENFLEEKQSIPVGEFRLLVFHDFNPANNIVPPHATQKEIEDVYSEEFKKYIIPVHTGEEEFKEEYREEDFIPYRPSLSEEKNNIFLKEELD